MTLTSTPAAAADTRSKRPVDVLRAVITTIGAQNLSLLVALALLVAIVGSQDQNFLRTQNLLAIGTAVTVFGILALVQTLVILLGGLDISVGSIAGLASVTSAMVLTSTSTSVSVFAALGVGLACGLVNGVIIVYGRVNPVIATLATLAAFKGVAQLISDGRAQGYTGNNDFYQYVARGDILGIPVLIFLLLGLAAVIQVVLSCTAVGRNIFAVGGNPVAARIAGVNLNRYILAIYLIVGLVAGVAGIILSARTGSGQPVSGSAGLELEAITAAALGGAALQGGKGSMVGCVLAILLLGVLSNGLTVLGVNPFWQNVAKGALLVIAVVIQQRRSGQRGVGLPT